MPTMTNPQRALQIWSLLAFAASKKTLVTYEEVSDLTGLPNNCGTVLGHVARYCAEHNLPLLSSIVVDKHTGKPSADLYVGMDVAAQQWNCFNFNWREHRPSLEDVREPWNNQANQLLARSS